VAGGPSCQGVLRDGSSVAVAGGTITGFCLASVISPGVGHVPQIAVEPQAQGDGIGGRLLDRALSGLARAGCRRATLSVSRSNVRAGTWYHRRGFRIVTRFASYHRDPGR
jgi:ribosomal protein S18 acetylase RimI-like enzyme